MQEEIHCDLKILNIVSFCLCEKGSRVKGAERFLLELDQQKANLEFIRSSLIVG